MIRGCCDRGVSSHARLAGAYYFPSPSPPMRDLCNYQQASRLIKETMEKKFNGSWGVIIGEGFGYEVRPKMQTIAARARSDTPDSCARLTYSGRALVYR